MAKNNRTFHQIKLFTRCSIICNCFSSNVETLMNTWLRAVQIIYYFALFVTVALFFYPNKWCAIKFQLRHYWNFVDPFASKQDSVLSRKYRKISFLFQNDSQWADCIQTRNVFSISCQINELYDANFIFCKKVFEKGLKWRDNFSSYWRFVMIWIILQYLVIPLNNIKIFFKGKLSKTLKEVQKQYIKTVQICAAKLFTIL